MKFLNRVLSFVFPHKCTFCHSSIDYANDTYICEKCMATLPFIKGVRCDKCNAPREEQSLPLCYRCRNFNLSFQKSFTPLLYTGIVRRALLNMKFYDKDYYCRSFAYLIVNNIIAEGFPTFDFITFVPLSDEGYKKRGYNQSELIAKKCGEILNIPVFSTLYRIDGTPKQSSLTFIQRRKNAKKSFFGKNLSLSGTALLIDDIYTTGSTAERCSSLLLRMGCDKVYIAAAALKPKD